MYTIEITPLSNGAHRNQTGTLNTIPDGWAVIPDDMIIPTSFPFVDITVTDGIVTSMTERAVPEPEPVTPEPTIATLSAQLKAVTESNAFLEECIVEMAGVIYA